MNIQELDQKEKKSFGHVSLHRSIIKSVVFEDPILFKLYMYCVMRAKFKEEKFPLGNQIVELKRGQFLTSYAKLLSAINGDKGTLTLKQLRGKIKQLEMAGKIEWKGQRNFSIIIVNNYDFWQSQGQTEKSQSPAKQRTQTLRGQNGHSKRANDLGEKGQTNNNLVLNKNKGYNKEEWQANNLGKGIVKGHSEGIHRATYNNVNKENKSTYRFLIYDFFDDVLKKSFNDKPNYVKYKLSSPSDFDRILVSYYLFDGRVFDNEIGMRGQLKQHRSSHVQELEAISKLKDRDYLQLMANFRANGRLTLENVAMACKNRASKTKALDDNTTSMREELNKRLGM